MVSVWVALHLVAGKLTFLDRTPRSRSLSVAGGISVAYVFLHVFPELRHYARSHDWAHELLVEGLALVGLVAFYSLERVVVSDRRRPSISPGVFWLHLGAFALYNLFVGAVWAREESESLRELLLAGFALGVHFLVNDHGLSEHHGERYRRVGRFILAGSASAGWAVGYFAPVPERILAGLFAFLAGGVILNVLKEELPEERESRFGAFVAGAALYGGIWLAL